MDQVGCVYTAQGFEFDYAGVIWGSDLVYDPDKSVWVGHKEKSFDTVVARAGDQFLDLVKNTYRVLLTRGLKGCYLCFTDKATERFVRSRTEGLEEAPAEWPKPVGVTEPKPLPAVPDPRQCPFREVPYSELRPYVNALPVVDLEQAARILGEGQTIDTEDAIWVEPPEYIRPMAGLFLAQVIGESMNRRIANGAWCLFRMGQARDSQGKVMLAKPQRLGSAKGGGAYTLGVCRYEPVAGRAQAVALEPDSTLSSFPRVDLSDAPEGFSLVAEMLTVV